MVSTQWGATTKRLVIVGLVILLVITLYLFRALLPPVAIAGVLAFLLKPIVDLLQRRAKMPRLLAVFLVFLALLVLISTIPVTVVPYLVDQIARINLDLQRLIDDLVAFLSRSFVIFGYRFNPQDLVGDVRLALQDLFRPFATQTVAILFNVASSMLWIVSILVIAFYLVKDADRLRTFLDSIAPPGHSEELQRLRGEINLVWGSFLRGQILLGLVIGLTVWIAMSAVGLPSAALMGLIAGLLEVIPSLGPVLATIPAVLVALLRGSTYLPLSPFWFAVLVLAIYITIQQVENAYIVPRIMGRRLHLHPVVVFLGVLAGGILAGALGVLLAAPIIATLRVLLKYVYAKLLDQAPFPSQKLERGEIYPGEIDAVLFDLDGTLVETDDAAVQALARRMQALGPLVRGRDLTKLARRLLMAFETPATRFLSLLDRVGLEDEVLGLGNRLRQLRGLQTAAELHPVDGMKPLLQELGRRYYLAIVTTRSHHEAESFLAKQELSGLIQTIAGRDDTWRIKPHPSPIQRAAEQLGVPVERCLVVGDTTVDIQAARAAGAWSVGVLSGFGTRPELERAGADRILASTHDLLNWL